MDLALPGGLVLTVLLSVLISGQAAGDGRSDWLKGGPATRGIPRARPHLLLHCGPSTVRRAALGALAALLPLCAAHADESGASAWLPGQFASFAAVPGDPGFSLEGIFYARSASATSGTDFPRGGRLLVGLDTREQYLFLTPSYTFGEPVLRGQLWLGVTFATGRADTSVWATLTGPGGNTLSAANSDNARGFSDLYPMASLKWQTGPHNIMTYTMVSVPTGAYDPDRLAGVGLGHWAIDGGMGYTFLAESGFELSVTAGLTYNFASPWTGYQSGVDGHVDLGTSYSLTEALYIGAVGYLYNQLSSDIGAPTVLGGFRSRAAGAGPQAGWAFTVGRLTIDLNLRAYVEFAAENRPAGWNAWLVVTPSRVKRKGSD